MAGAAASAVVAWVVNQEAALLAADDDFGMLLAVEAGFISGEAIVQNWMPALHDRLDLCNAAAGNVGKAAVKALHIAGQPRSRQQAAEAGHGEDAAALWQVAVSIVHIERLVLDAQQGG